MAGTPTAKNLKKLLGLASTLTSTEMNILDGVTASAAELNLIDGSTAGTVVASKAVVVGSNKEIDTLVIADGGLKLGSGAGTAVTSTAAELNILDGVTATAAELNMAADISANSEIVTATNAIAAAEAGTTYFLNSATEFASTLPAPVQGMKFSFVVTAAPSGASYTIVTNGSANIIKGQVYTLDVDSATNPDLETSGGDTITFVDSKAVAGDRVDLLCDGTNWFAYGFCSVFDAITITTAS